MDWKCLQRKKKGSVGIFFYPFNFLSEIPRLRTGGLDKDNWSDMVPLRLVLHFKDPKDLGA